MSHILHFSAIIIPGSGRHTSRKVWSGGAVGLLAMLRIRCPGLSFPSFTTVRVLERLSHCCVSFRPRTVHRCKDSRKSNHGTLDLCAKRPAASSTALAAPRGPGAQSPVCGRVQRRHRNASLFVYQSLGGIRRGIWVFFGLLEN